MCAPAVVIMNMPTRHEATACLFRFAHLRELGDRRVTDSNSAKLARALDLVSCSRELSCRWDLGNDEQDSIPTTAPSTIVATRDRWSQTFRSHPTNEFFRGWLTTQ